MCTQGVLPTPLAPPDMLLMPRSAFCIFRADIVLGMAIETYLFVQSWPTNLGRRMVYFDKN